MPSAEIITIGTELLLGEIVDTNSAYLARKLRDLGVDIFRTSTVGDNADRIADVIRETMQRSQIIITTGGLGPTVDDPTREAVALAVDEPTEFRPELWDQITARMQKYGRAPTENQKRQAYVPHGAIAIQNPVGTAPAFIIETGQITIISLPGVPREMEYLTENTVLPYLRGRYQLTGTIKARVLHTAGVGEGQIDEWVGDLEMQGNPTVGLAAHAGMVDIRITAKATSLEEADSMIASLENTIRARLGKAIFGVDGETLEEVTIRQLEKQAWPLTILEVGMGGALIQRLSRPESSIYLGGEAIPSLPENVSLIDTLVNEMDVRGADCALGVAITPGSGQTDIEIALITPTGGEKTIQRSYGGHPRNGSIWAANIALDMLRLASA
jgi:nicotinamide-nucleotide amidase